MLHFSQLTSYIITHWLFSYYKKNHRKRGITQYKKYAIVQGLVKLSNILTMKVYEMLSFYFLNSLQEIKLQTKLKQL
jgi:hypothetical protein